MYTHYSLFALRDDWKTNPDAGPAHEIADDFRPLPVGGIDAVISRFYELIVRRYGVASVTYVSTMLLSDGEICMVNGDLNLSLYTPAAIANNVRHLSASADEEERQAASLALAASREPIRVCPCCGQPIVETQ